MDYNEFKSKLLYDNTSNPFYNAGIKDANSRSIKLVKKVFDYFELSINEAKKTQKDNARLKILFDSEFCRCSKCGEYKRSGFYCCCSNEKGVE